MEAQVSVVTTETIAPHLIVRMHSQRYVSMRIRGAVLMNSDSAAIGNMINNFAACPSTMIEPAS